MIHPHFQILPDYIASRSLLRCVMLPITLRHAPYYTCLRSLSRGVILPITSPHAPYYALFAYGLGLAMPFMA